MNYWWIGHCREDTSDKIWGLIKLNDDKIYCDYVSFWGRRGKKLQTKIYKNIPEYHAHKLSDKKMDNGYKTINPTRLDEVYPEFEQDLETTAVWAMLKV
jgi:hypothetical protein